MTPLAGAKGPGFWVRSIVATVSAVAGGGWRLVTGSKGSAIELKPGDPAPLFELPGSDGRLYRLADFAGREAVVLAWFPKAFTGG